MRRIKPLRDYFGFTGHDADLIATYVKGLRLCQRTPIGQSKYSSRNHVESPYSRNQLASKSKKHIAQQGHLQEVSEKERRSGNAEKREFD